MDQTTNDLTNGHRALIVEDELAIAQLLKINLQNMGIEVSSASSAEEASAFLQKNNFSILILDWMLPGQQGLEFLNSSRTKLGITKVMMVTAKADPESIVAGLDCGADDYLTKPFDSKVLAARVRQLIRRYNYENKILSAKNSGYAIEQDEIEYDGLVLNLKKHTVKLNKQDIHLTPSEFKLLAELLKAQGQVLTRDRLIDLIQGHDVTVTGRTIDTHVFALRKKIGRWASHVETIRGVGYRILMSMLDATEVEK
jgi:DNA-binding response OmpR family regulator